MKKIPLMVMLLLIINLSFSAPNTPFPQFNLIIGHGQSPVTNGSNGIFLPFVTKQEDRAYYVAMNGNDTNPGTQLSPWRTIGKSARVARPGDTVIVRGGTYNEAVSLDFSGSEANPIKLMAYPGENPVIDGGFTKPGYGGALLSLRGNYLQVSGFEVRNSGYMGILVNGSNVVVNSVYVHDSKGPGVLISQGSNSVVENSRVWKNNGTGLSAARQGVMYATIRHNTVWENSAEGISSFEANFVTIEDNISHDNNSTNIYISDSTNVLCQRNFVYMNPRSVMYGKGANVGIMMGDESYTPASANIRVLNNIAYGNHRNYFWWQGSQGGGMKNVLIANNTFVNGTGNSSNGEGGVIIGKGNHQNVIFENNLVQQDGTLPVIATVTQTGITYSHNLWSKSPSNAAVGLGDVIGDPNLAKIGDPYLPGWFKLNSLSSAIDKALSIPEVADDYYGTQRGSKPDNGAIEYVANP